MPDWSGEGEVIQGSRCPKCGAPLEYNGNYWCSETECSYTMPDQRMTKADKHAFNVAYILLMQQTGREPNPDSLYPEAMPGG